MFVDKGATTVTGQASNEWPYKKLEHWPPMTYRDKTSLKAEDVAAFKEYLNTENHTEGDKELQPWIPFCDGRCAFCYFPVSCKKHDVPAYMATMKKVLSRYAQTKYVKSSVFREIYVGGGSPTVLSKTEMGDILQFCRTNFNLSSDCYTKFTACTTNLSTDNLQFLSSQRVDQIDVGIQTFDDAGRKMLRLQDSSAAAQAKLKETKKHNLRVSIDLLYNLPGQTVEQWEKDINQALALDVESVDCYPLDLYPDTPLAKQIAAGEVPPLNGDARELDMYCRAFEIFKKNGYVPTCHNRFTRLKEDLNEPSTEVIGSGAGFFMGRIGKFMYSDVESVQDYIAAASTNEFPLAQIATFTPEEEMKNAMMLIYVRVAVDRQKFKRQFGKYPEEAFPNAFKRLKEKQLIEIVDDKIRLTPKGDVWRFNVAWEFLDP
jgi:oxygen-independent coproporphyrinogen-3 oxidase